MSNLLEKASIITTPTAYSDGVLHSVKPVGGENILVQSNQFDTTWSSFNINAITNGFAGYNGSSDAWKATTNGSSFSRISQTIDLNGVYTASIYSKKAEYDFVGLYFHGVNRGVVVSLVDGSVVNPIINYPDFYTNAEDVGNGWFRISISHTLNGSGEIRIYPCETSVYNGNTTEDEGVYIQDAQIQRGYKTTAYVDTTISAVLNADFTFTRNNIGTRVNASGNIESIGVDLPRIDYLGGIGSLLLEPETTNTATDSNDFTTGDIFEGSNPPNLTSAILTSNQATSPDSTNNAWKLTDNNDGISGGCHIGYFSTNVISENYNTFSLFVKKQGNNDWVSIDTRSFDATRESWFNISNGTLGNVASGHTASIDDYGNGWYRIAVTLDPSQAANVGQLFVSLSVGVTGNETNSFSGDGVSGVYIFGMQFEEQSYPTSYIPTSGSPETRALDSALDAGSSDLISSTEGVLYAELSTVLNTDSKRISLSDGNSLNRVEFGFDIASNSLRIIVKSNDNDIINSQEVISSDITNFIKVAIKYESGDTKVFVNGNSVGNTSTVSFSNIGTMDRLNLSTHTSSSYQFQGKVKDVRVYNTALTDLELTVLTAPNISRIFNERVLADGGIIESLDCIESVEFRFTDYYSRVINNGGIIESLECVSL